MSTASKFCSYRHSAASVDRRYIPTHTRALVRSLVHPHVLHPRLGNRRRNTSSSVWLITQIGDGSRGGANTRYILALTAKLIPICNALSCLQYRRALRAALFVIAPGRATRAALILRNSRGTPLRVLSIIDGGLFRSRLGSIMER